MEMVSKVYDKLLARQSLSSWFCVILGSVILSAGFVLFMNPYRVVPGGVYGTGIVLHALNMNLSQDMFLVCIFGGVFLGCGTGLIIKGHATSGGTDIIAMLLTRYTRMRFSRAILLVDSCIIVFGMVVLGDWRLPLYSLITIFVSSRIIDYIIDGPSYDKLLFIISDRQDEIREFILDKMDRGGTYIKSTGMYTAQQRDMIFLVVSRNEVSMLQNMIHQIDPASFVVIVDAYETYGDGFKAFPEKK